MHIAVMLYVRQLRYIFGMCSGSRRESSEPGKWGDWCAVRWSWAHINSCSALMQMFQGRARR